MVSMEKYLKAILYKVTSCGVQNLMIKKLDVENMTKQAICMIKNCPPNPKILLVNGNRMQRMEGDTHLYRFP